VLSATLGCTRAQSMEKAPPPAIRITVGVPSPVQYKCSLRRPMSIKRPGGEYDSGVAF
jgi:hypothetical protein